MLGDFDKTLMSQCNWDPSDPQPPPSRTRVERLEMLDDVQIAQQLYDHYCIVLAVTDDVLCPWSTLEQPLSMVP